MFMFFQAYSIQDMLLKRIRIYAWLTQTDQTTKIKTHVFHNKHISVLSIQKRSACTDLILTSCCCLSLTAFFIINTEEQEEPGWIKCLIAFVWKLWGQNEISCPKTCILYSHSQLISTALSWAPTPVFPTDQYSVFPFIKELHKAGK